MLSFNCVFYMPFQNKELIFSLQLPGLNLTFSEIPGLKNVY